MFWSKSQIGIKLWSPVYISDICLLLKQHNVSLCNLSDFKKTKKNKPLICSPTAVFDSQAYRTFTKGLYAHLGTTEFNFPRPSLV